MKAGNEVNKMGLIIGTFYIIILAVTIVIIIQKKNIKIEGEEFCIRENKITAFLGIALWIESGIIAYYSITFPERLFLNNNSIINVCIFMAASVLLGSGMMLYTFVKRIVFTKNELILVNLLGQLTRIGWNNIRGVSQTNGKRLAFQDKDRTKIVVGGNRNMMKRAFKKIYTRIPKFVDNTEIQKLETTLMR
ncbi:hypothetical protein [Muricomes intestini]|nr:hypothetical protein [Muricomes intestini]HAX50455.1 hypothetical protein [Lachnospiraceae bacterium]HBI73451.1 hypothetical protein [Lachnospiraceae bacterium]HCR84842.1 hypothetical protein [Lachnospiraceae bacterium]